MASRTLNTARKASAPCSPKPTSRRGRTPDGCSDDLMATLPISAEAVIARFGPSLNFPPPEGYPGRDEPDEVVKTHCCFCGMQCGIKLLVKENRIVGFEPWEEFPFNEGRLCP